MEGGTLGGGGGVGGGGGNVTCNLLGSKNGGRVIHSKSGNQR